MVLRVTRVYDDSYCYLFPHIAEPKRMLIYFYEGNDLDDNYMLLDHRVRPDGGDLRAQIDRFLDEHYAMVNGWLCHGHFGDMLFRMARFLVRYRNLKWNFRASQPRSRSSSATGRMAPGSSIFRRWRSTRSRPRRR